MVKALLGGWVQIGVLGRESYLIAKKRGASIEVFATYSKSKGHLQKEGPGYRSDLIKTSGPDTFEKLKGKVLGLVEPASTSGDLIPRAVFTKEIGSKLKGYFSKVVYTGGHDLSTLAVKEGRIDAAFAATHHFDNVVNRGLIKVDDVNILWKSPVIPAGPVRLSHGSLPRDPGDIRTTFLGLQDDPTAAKLLANLKTDRFVTMSDKDYDVVREAEAATMAAK